MLAKEQQQRIDKILIAVGAQGVRALVFPVDLAVRRRNAVAAFEHDVAAAARKHQAECQQKQYPFFAHGGRPPFAQFVFSQ